MIKVMDEDAASAVTNGYSPQNHVPVTSSVNEGYQGALKTEDYCKHHDFISVSEGGHCLIGSSNLNGRYWIGNLCYYSNANEALNSSAYTARLSFETGVCDGKFINDEKVIIGDDYGRVYIYSISEEKLESKYIFYQESSWSDQHDDSVVSLSISSTKIKAVSGSLDYSIRVWDLDQFHSDHIYDTAHTHQVKCVAFSTNSDNVFASASLDGSVLLWDTRKDKPARALIEIPEDSNGFTAVAWFKEKENEALVGSENGFVSIIDIRNPNDVVCTSNIFDRGIYRFRMHLDNRLVAACSDSNEVKVIQCTADSISLKYSNNDHTGLVRGLDWYKSDKNPVLLSTGYDVKILQHTPF